VKLPKSLRMEETFFRSKVARRIFLLFVVCALIPLTVLAYFSFSQVTKNLYSQAYGRLHESSKTSGMTIFERLLFLETDLNMLTTNLQKGKEDPSAYFFPGFRDRLANRFSGVALMNGNGGIKSLLGKVPVLPRWGKDEQDFLDSGKTLVLSRVSADKEATIYMIKALDGRRSPNEFLVGEIDPGYLWGGEGFLSPLTQIFVLDQSRHVLFSSSGGFLPLDEIRSVLRENPAMGRFAWAGGDGSYLASYWTVFMVPRFGVRWIVVRSQSRADVLAPVSNFREIFPLLVLLTFLIAVLLSLGQIRRSLVPIEMLREATRKIAAKKFDSRVTIKTGDEFEELGDSFNRMAMSLENYLNTMVTLNSIGIALSAEKDNNRLLRLTLKGAKEITGSDGSALYLLAGDSHLELSVMEIDSPNIRLDRKDRVEVSLYDAGHTPNVRDAIAYSVLNDATVNIPDVYRSQEFDPSFYRDLDRRTGHNTSALLIVPLKNHENEIVGVLQLIKARKRALGEAMPFSEEDQRLLETLASEAAVALSKNRLIDDFKELFDSLVELIATAIDKKSPYTGDHCRRVPELTLMLAEAVSDMNEGVFSDFTLSKEELYELKIAALLHDCGKVTTPVHIVDKATRLETIFDRIRLVDMRFEVVKRDVQIASLQKQLAAFSERSVKEIMEERERTKKILGQIDEDRQFIRDSNSGEFAMNEERRKRIRDIALKYRWVGPDHKEETIVSEDEVHALTSSQGTLTPEERAIVNQHVEVTVKMLESLHYPKSLRNVPLFARAHHEHMDGRGYPRGLTREQIPLQGRIIALADVFEALTARNRPYKKGKTLMEALRVLGAMKEDGQIDPDLFDIFIQKEIYLQYAEKYMPPEQLDEIVLSRIPGYVPRLQ